MGASFQAGAQVLMVQEMTFPIKEDLALATLFYELMNSAQAGPSSLIGDMLKPLFMFFNIDPTEYTTMLKLQIGTYVRGTASVTAGLRYGDTNTVKTWSNSDKEEAFTKGDGWRLFFLANMLSASIGLGPEGQLAMGLEYKVLAPPDSGHQPFLVDPVSGNRIPRLCEFNAYTEAQAALNMQLPILSSLPLPIPPSFGGGIKLNFIYKFRAEDHLPGNEADHRFEKFRLGFYQVSGELDIYQGSASEVVVWFDPTALTGPVDLNPGGVQQALINAVPTTFNDLREMVDGTQVKIRLGLNGIGGWRNKLKLFMQKMRSLHILIKHDGKRHWGLIYGLYSHCPKTRSRISPKRCLKILEISKARAFRKQPPISWSIGRWAVHPRRKWPWSPSSCKNSTNRRRFFTVSWVRVLEPELRQVLLARFDYAGTAADR